MWTRKELKEKAKERLRMNYWKCILAALLLGLIGGGVGIKIPEKILFGNRGSSSSEEEYEFEEYEDDGPNLDEFFSSIGEKSSTFGDGEFDDGKGVALMVVFVTLLMVLFIFILVLLVVVLPLHILLINPMEVGIRRFFARNLKEQANIREVCYAFDHSYKNCVKVQFFRGLYIFLWSLLLVVPGIIKAYEYKMMPYILAEEPEISIGEAFVRSKFMMDGNKWKAFVLDLSFLGWYILSGMTFGILSIFYVGPYVEQTRAALYRKLKEQKGSGNNGIYDSGCR